jgi:hypothetical protein
MNARHLHIPPVLPYIYHNSFTEKKPHMKRHTYLLIVFVLSVANTGFGQAAQSKPDPEIAKMAKEVSAKRIEADIRKLVSFGTRNTLSEQDNPTRGIGAARDWIYSEFQKISAECGGCLDVQKQAFVQPKAQRIPEPTTLTNVFAVLKGTTDPTRVYVVSGHYDSMYVADRCKVRLSGSE